MSEYTIPHTPSPFTEVPNLAIKTDKNTHVVLTSPLHISLENRPIPTPGPNDVLVKVMATGICGTDFSYYARGGVGSRRATGPHVLGHEAAGVVYCVGDEVVNIKPGDHVALEPALPCYRCRYCREGQWNYCVHDGYFATPPYDGTLCEWFKCPALNAVRIPQALSWPEAGCIQPLAIAVQIARRAGTLTQKSVGVFGAGPLGLLCMAVARAYGARRIVAFDISPPRVEFATGYAASDGAVCPSPPADADIMQWNDGASADILAKLGEPPLDVVLEASGAESAMQLGISLLRPGGTFVAAGMGKPMTSFPSLELSAKELNVIGSLRYTSGCFEDAINLVERGVVDLKPLITAKFPLEEAEDAFKAVRDGKEIKVVILNHPEE